ncbi:MAG: type II toxin-antitoxin system PemK/MazF family toxin [Candidatus Magasanikbacteria bacterium]|nr:type II toxin-antitoxin system PemK/MazF family toxin [Candidatus Magasanikbacteria bacterium]
MYQKEFDNWNHVKQIADRRRISAKIRAGEIRWMIFGVNVGSEIDGKGRSFQRPGLILNVIGHDLAFIIPLTSKQKDPPRYIPFKLDGCDGSLCLHQIKVISQNRILNRIERISDARMNQIRQAIILFHHLLPPTE